MKILSAEQIRKWDEYTILNEPISSIDLMERASTKCTEWIENAKLFDLRFKIFCGQGNNGGDGLAIARQLAAKNVDVDVFIAQAGGLGTNDFQENLNRLHSSPVQIHSIHNPDFFPLIDEYDIVIDALFGSGLNRPLERLQAELVKHINSFGATVISIDLPSGMFADSATTSDAVIKATHTLTFQTLKLSFLLPENEQYSGNVSVLNIGLHNTYVTTVSSDYELLEHELLKKIYKRRKAFSHKGTFGHALVIAGEKGKMGAAVLCSRACLRAGAGLVTVMVPKDQFAIIQTALPEAMAISHQEMETLDWTKYSTIAIGPGIGNKNDGAKLVKKVLTTFTQPLVIDADALNILAGHPELLDFLPAGSILSPHLKEFERLFGKPQNHLERIQLARKHAQNLSIYIIIKGHYSVLVCPDGPVYFNSTGNAGMATAGSGDVLSGILAGLLSQGYSSKEVGLLGMFLHGLAADIAVTTCSQEALIAGDITENLGKAFLDIGSR
jgi:NAD(P)H-hydrate epimerase